MANTFKPPFLMFLAASAMALLLSMIAGLMGGGAEQPTASSFPSSIMSANAQQAAPAKSPMWAASAPGRVEPRGGEVRVGAQSAGRISEVAAALNDVVQAGDLLIRIEDDDARARLVAADAEAAVRRRERDAEAASNRLAADRRTAEDQLAATERTALIARTDLDRALRLQRAGTGTADDVAKERAALKAALDKVDADRAALRRAQTAQGIPLPTRLEAGLTAARAEVALAEQALERTRLRAPSNGTILQLNSRIGETVAPSPEQVLIVLGDLTALRVRAEVEERDVGRVRVGQAVVLRTDAFPGREFTGSVATRAQALGPAKLGQRGPRRPTDVDTLEVMIDVDAGTPLLPGLRVDVFFRADGAQSSTFPVAPQMATPEPARKN